jgi:hypothetical protein
MCLNCGCDLPYEDWDNPDNITVDTIKNAAATPKSEGLTANQIIQRIMTTWRKVNESDKNYTAGKAHTHSIGDVIDDLMDSGMNKQNAVDKAEGMKGLLGEGYSDKMKAIKSKASSY